MDNNLTRRFVIFILLGPLLVWFTWFLLHTPMLMRSPGGMVFLLLVIILVLAGGFLPAIVLAWIDHGLATCGVPLRVRAGLCAALGYVAAVVTFWISLRDIGFEILLVNSVFVAGLYGIVPAGVCSWLAGRYEHGRAEPKVS